MTDLNKILIALVATAIFIPISSLALWALTRILKLADKRFLTALKTAAAAGAALFATQQAIGFLYEKSDVGTLIGAGGLIFLATTAITITVNYFAVKLIYKENAGKALIAGMAWTIINWIIGLATGALIVAAAIEIVIGQTGANTIII